MDNFKEISSHFQFEGTFECCEEVHSGNINKTYKVTYRLPDGAEIPYILQSINTFVFKSPENVMCNIANVTEHLRVKLIENGRDEKRGVLTIIPTADGGILYISPEGVHWRAYVYVVHAHAFDMVEKPEHFYQAGKAFGEFQKMLSDFPADTLFDIIPDFHNTPKRIAAFERAVSADVSSRLCKSTNEVSAVLAGKDKAGRIMNLLASGALPLRVTHNDTKINNVLIDEDTMEGICVIDLDTVMPGSSLFDFGDAIRYGASTAAEDELDLSRVSLDLSLYRQFTEGFLSAVVGFLPESEIRHLPLGVWTITYELATRFLTDYLEGDVYFKTLYPEHNLDRARCQLRLLADIEAKEPQLNNLIDEILKRSLQLAI